ncbi:MAG: nitronate monooxygenase family protein [Eubacterium sp.]|nr:nitronate monooxygenase family protein [Eubacterium sp.]
MKEKGLKIGELTAKIPLIQGGMGVGISLGGLAGAVAKEGGVGIISSAQIGFREADFQENPLKANLKAMRKELQKARSIAPEGIIGFNIMVAANHYKEQVLEALRSGADLIISGAGLPVDLPEYVKDSTVKIAPIVSSEKSAKVLLRLWDKRYQTTADLVVIEGPKAGGHLGFKKEEIQEKLKNYKAEIQKIIRVVREFAGKYQREIPVVLAGGIQTREDVEQALTMDIQGVQVATRFVPTLECDADEKYKEAYIQANSKDAVIVQSPVGMPGRALRNSFIKRVEAGEKFPPKKCLGCMKKCNPKEIPYCITERLIHAANGNVEEALIFCGAGVGNEKQMRSVKDVIEELF